VRHQNRVENTSPNHILKTLICLFFQAVESPQIFSYNCTRVRKASNPHISNGKPDHICLIKDKLVSHRSLDQLSRLGLCSGMLSWEAELVEQGLWDSKIRRGPGPGPPAGFGSAEERKDKVKAPHRQNLLLSLITPGQRKE